MPSQLPRNNFKRELAAGKAQVGFWMTLASTMATEIAAGAGFHWLLIDMEHTPNDVPDVLNHMRAAVGGTAEPVIRVPWNDFVLVKRLLDMGARSFFFPTVQSAEEAKAAVAATRYPPDGGIRGFSSTSRATRYGRVPNYFHEYANEICVIVQIETREGLNAMDEICAVDGVDGVFLGPGDLSACLGHIGKPGAPEIRDVIMNGMKTIRSHGKAPGMTTSSAEDAKKLFDAGFLFVAAGSDTGAIVRLTDSLATQFNLKAAS